MPVPLAPDWESVGLPGGGGMGAPPVEVEEVEGASGREEGIVG